jgi:hypothetical protein
MAHVYLPVAHTEADLVLAGQIAELIDSAELYVAWTAQSGRAIPEVVAELRAAVPRWTGTLALVFQAVRELWTLLLGRPHQPQALPAAVERPAQPKPAA